MLLLKWYSRYQKKHYYHFILFSTFILAHSDVGWGNLVLRRFVTHALLNFRDIACYGAELNCALSSYQSEAMIIPLNRMLSYLLHFDSLDTLFPVLDFRKNCLNNFKENDFNTFLQKKQIVSNMEPMMLIDEIYSTSGRPKRFAWNPIFPVPKGYSKNYLLALS